MNVLNSKSYRGKYKQAIRTVFFSPDQTEKQEAMVLLQPGETVEKIIAEHYGPTALVESTQEY